MKNIHLPVERVLCMQHSTPFRGTWPRGYPQFIHGAMDGLRHCDQWLNAIQGDTASIEAALSKWPACCVLAATDPDLLLTVYEAIHKAMQPSPWCVGRCVTCRRQRVGFTWHRGGKAEHRCLRCVAVGGHAERAKRVFSDVRGL